jgi:CheY-like chemotaxis protein
MVSTYQPFLGGDNLGAHNQENPRRGSALASAARLPETLPRKKKILHVEFDRVLLTTRHVLLETAGFEVISCFSSMAAREVSTGNAQFDIFLIGHAASMLERNDLVTWIRAHFPGVPVIALRSRDTDFSPPGDATAVADPDELLKAIVDVLKVR